MRWLGGIANSMDILLEIVKNRNHDMVQSMGSQRVGQDWATKHSTEQHRPLNINYLI